MKSYVSISRDISHATTVHKGMGTPLPCVEVPIPMFWPPGMTTGANQLTHTVFHQGLPICQARHDIGRMIPHATTPPAPENVIQTASSSRRHLFSGSKCRANGKALAAGGTINLASTPCLACAEPVSIPMIGNISMALSSRVTFGISATDLVLGWADLLTEVLVDAAGSVIDAAFEKQPVIAWAFKTVVSNVKGLAVGAYKMITEDGEAELAIHISSPEGGDFYAHSHGLRRDENGKLHLFRKDRIGEHEVSAQLSVDRRPELDVDYRKVANRVDGDVIVERDGKKYRYHGAGLDDAANPSKVPDKWGRVTPEDEP